MNRRHFLGIASLGALQPFLLANHADPSSEFASSPPSTPEEKPFGSGHFGEWVTDSFGLPAYRYTCDQLTDPLAISPVHKQWRSPTDHTHQLGNDRLVAAVSNYGYVQVRQDEGSPKFLNDYYPEGSRFGGGLGFLTDGHRMLSTYYAGNAESFERILGLGYLRKIVKGYSWAVDQLIFAPFGEDPVLLSIVTVRNESSDPADLRWVEYWGCQNYQFSYRSFMQAYATHAAYPSDLRRKFAARFSHQFRELPGGSGLTESQKFLGRSDEDEKLWAGVQAHLEKNPNDFLGGPLPPLAAGAAFEDLNPPATFLVSLDAAPDSYATDSTAFFGTGGVANPSGLAAPLVKDLSTSGPSSAFLLERRLGLKPNESRTLSFLYGYLPEGYDAASLVARYSSDPAATFLKSCSSWKNDGPRLRVPSEPWVERETAWNNYYLRSNLTYDAFFHEPILSQGHVYQYIIGFQGAARDPLQHALPFVFSRPEILRSVIRYTLKETQPDGSIPYGIVGSGVPMPAVFRPSDLEMWLLWAAAEYVLVSRDTAFLHEKIPALYASSGSAAGLSVAEHLRRAYVHLTTDIGVGQHGLMRLSNGDWNDEVVVFHGSAAGSDEVRKLSESVLNAAMATYVLDYYARMLDSAGDSSLATEARSKAEAQRVAVRSTWQGEWYRRAWLGPQIGWIGEDHLWLEPQPWAIIGGASSPEQRHTLTDSINRLVRRPSPIGAMVQSKGDPTMDNAVGTATNGGIWPSINGTLIWALALEDGAQAWDEWKKNCLALHAEAYPDIWYGIWSGPDTYNSVLSKFPGQTMFFQALPQGATRRTDQGLNWTDFPVMNMHPHAWPIYSAAKLLGLDFNERGFRLAPLLPLLEYEFSSPVFGFKKSAGVYSGWYRPFKAGNWEIELAIPPADLERVSKGKVNELPIQPSKSAGALRFSGASSPGVPLRWELS